jgi:Tol biopolymer transport system component
MPDSRIVYASFINNSYSLWTMNADGSDARPLTSEGFIDRFPDVTPDGRFVVFESNRGTGSDVWRVDADGTHLRQLTTGGHSAQPSLAPDGRSIVYTATVDGAPSIRRISIDGGAPKQVAPVPSTWPSVSPDGTRVAYVTEDAARLPQIAVASLEHRTTVAQFDVARGASLNNGVRWSPDGAALVYRDFGHGLWRQPIAGGKPARLSDVPARRIYFYAWAKDRSRFAMSYGDEVRDVVLISGFR